MAPEALNEMALFAGCSRKELERVRSLSTFLDVAPGKTLTLQGEMGYECMLVCQGTIDIVRDGRSIAQAGPGDLVGEIALLDRRAGLRTATAQTLTQAQVLVFNSREFATMLQEMPAVAARVQETTVHRLVDQKDHGSPSEA
ncbi:MAG: putative transcriptional regulator [Frankiales bacterium]|nr:putative transcriptional regulator [Frankiales bacterium]